VQITQNYNNKFCGSGLSLHPHANNNRLMFNNKIYIMDTTEESHFTPYQFINSNSLINEEFYC